MPRRTLVALSHAFEDAFAGPGAVADGQNLVIGLFQHAGRFAAETDRYEDFARRATVIVAHTGDGPEVAGVHRVRLEMGEPLAREWTLVGLAPGGGAALVATERHDISNGRAGQVFEARWSFRRGRAAREASRILDTLGSRLPPVLHSQAQDLVAGHADCPGTPGEQLHSRLLNGFVSRTGALPSRPAPNPSVVSR